MLSHRAIPPGSIARGTMRRVASLAAVQKAGFSQGWKRSSITLDETRRDETRRDRRVRSIRACESSTPLDKRSKLQHKHRPFCVLCGVNGPRWSGTAHGSGELSETRHHAENEDQPCRRQTFRRQRLGPVRRSKAGLNHGMQEKSRKRCRRLRRTTWFTSRWRSVSS